MRHGQLVMGPLLCAAAMQPLLSVASSAIGGLVPLVMTLFGLHRQKGVKPWDLVRLAVVGVAIFMVAVQVGKGIANVRLVYHSEVARQSDGETEHAECERLKGIRSPIRQKKGTVKDCNEAKYIAESWPLSRTYDTCFEQWAGLPSWADMWSTLENKVVFVSLALCTAVVILFLFGKLDACARDRLNEKRLAKLMKMQLIGHRATHGEKTV